MGDKKFVVEIWEYERGWGSKVDSKKEFDKKEDAIVWIKMYNADNSSDEVPDWYMVAKPGNFEME